MSHCDLCKCALLKLTPLLWQSDNQLKTLQEYISNDNSFHFSPIVKHLKHIIINNNWH